MGQVNWTAFLLFSLIVAGTILITYWASKKTNTTSEFYTAGRGLRGWQNGLAIAGDYMSAASFLGIAGTVALVGFDGFFYSIGFLVAYLVVLYLVAEPLRNLGKYTMADMIAARFDDKKVRGVAALSTITIAQLVGAGALIKLLLGLNYTTSVIIVGILMTFYVVFGGMRATSWVQIIKAMLLMGGTFVISFIVFYKFNFSLTGMFEQMKAATPLKEGFLNPGNKYKVPLDTLSLVLALVLGTAGLPHILIRFFTVKDAPTARSSVVYATWIIGIFYVLTLFLGFGAAAFVGNADITAADKAGNMAAPLLAKALGGDFLFAFISAVAFATILAVVTGLVLSAASAFTHDFYTHIIRRGQASEREQMTAARWASFGVSAVTILLVAVSPSVWGPAGKAILIGEPLITLTNPGIISIPLGFAAAVVGTLLSSKRSASHDAKFDEILVRANTGIGMELEPVLSAAARASAKGLGNGSAGVPLK